MPNDQLSIAFLGTLVPDTIEFHNPAFYRSSNMVQAGIIEGLKKQNIRVKVLSSQPIPTFPRNKSIFCKRKVLHYSKDIKLTTIPALNVVVIREIMKGIYALFSLIIWAIKNRNNKRCIIVYNIYSPPIPIVYLTGKLTRSKNIAMIYDLGMPPKSLNLDILRRLIYKIGEINAKYIIPKLDGRIVITEAIARDYAPNKHFIMIDGGISDNIKNRLFKLELKPPRLETIFLCAGSLWHGNGVELILDAMKLNKNQYIKIWFAGTGPNVPLIDNASKKDTRIDYKGLLNLDKLFQVYQGSDVLLNIRVVSHGEGDYLFPSKFLEYLSIGKLVISTSVVHIKRDYGHLCVILDEANPRKLSDLLDYVSNISNNDLFEKGIIARQFMLNNHTWDQKSIQIVNYIKQKVFLNI